MKCWPAAATESARRERRLAGGGENGPRARWGGRRRKVLLVITRLIRGGAQRELLELLAGLDRVRFQVSLAASPEGGWAGRAAARADRFFPIPELVRPISPGRDLRAFLRLLRLLRRQRFDIVHTHTSKAGILGRLAARVARVPVVVHTPHGTVYHESFLSPGMQQVIARLERLAARLTDRIITKSASEANEYIGRGIAARAKFLTIHSGLDFRRLERVQTSPAALRASLGLAPERPVVLYPARVAPEKDHACFLRAFQIVLGARPEAVALLAGDGPRRAEIEAEAATLIPRGSLLSLGFREDLPDLMRAADVCVSASLSEGLPLTVAEALALGRPVVATGAGGTGEIVKDGVTGLLVPAGDSEALAAAILRLLREPELARRLGDGGRRLVSCGFEAGEMVARTSALYEELYLASEGRARRSFNGGGWRSRRDSNPRSPA